MSDEIELTHLEFHGGPFDGWNRPSTSMEGFCEEMYLEDGVQGQWYTYKLDRKEYRKEEDGSVTEVGHYKFQNIGRHEP